MKKKFLFIELGFILLSCAFTSCSSGEDIIPSVPIEKPIAVSNVALDKASLELLVDSTAQLTATTWTVNYPAAQLTLEAGKLYTFTATLGADAHITLDAGAVNISDWSEGDQINIGR